jgi:hypothetical protein
MVSIVFIMAPNQKMDLMPGPSQQTTVIAPYTTQPDYRCSGHFLLPLFFTALTCRILA